MQACAQKQLLGWPQADTLSGATGAAPAAQVYAPALPALQLGRAGARLQAPPPGGASLGFSAHTLCWPGCLESAPHRLAGQVARISVCRLAVWGFPSLNQSICSFPHKLEDHLHLCACPPWAPSSSQGSAPAAPSQQPGPEIGPALQHQTAERCLQDWPGHLTGGASERRFPGQGRAAKRERTLHSASPGSPQARSLRWQALTSTRTPFGAGPPSTIKHTSVAALPTCSLSEMTCGPLVAPRAAPQPRSLPPAPDTQPVES